MVTRAPAVRALGVVDSDSFVKWGANLLARTPSTWDRELVLIDTKSTASDTQVEAALAGGPFSARAVRRMSLPDLIDRLESDPVDALFVTTRGPVAEVIASEVTRRVHPRPVMITGLPGISVPAKWKGLFLRSQCDLFVLHSKREIREYAAMASEGGLSQRFGLARLPFLDVAVQEPSTRPDSIIFAAQPSVPSLPEDRSRVVGWLADVARAHPELRVVLKIRAKKGEKQTHHEEFPYSELVPADAPSNLIVAGGSMAAHLARAVGFVTISSTATLEAVARGVPSIVLTDFGVDRKLINEVFIGSGLLGSSQHLLAGRFHRVTDDWRDDNYFHAAEDADWIDQLTELLEQRAAAAMPARAAARTSRGGALRRAWERKLAFGSHDRSALGVLALVIGTPVSIVRRRIRAANRRSTGVIVGASDSAGQAV